MKTRLAIMAILVVILAGPGAFVWTLDAMALPAIDVGQNRQGAAPASEGSSGSAPSWIAYASAVTATVSILVTIWYTRRTALRNMRPVLVFVYQEDGWHVQNVGYGPALDVIFARKPREGEWYDPVRLPPLAKDRDIHLEWTDHDNIHSFGVSYRDVEGRQYTSTCSNDLNRISQGRKLPEWSEEKIHRHWRPKGAVEPDRTF
jgi:hypothetical protein